jgi:hypothetical protein
MRRAAARVWGVRIDDSQWAGCQAILTSSSLFRFRKKAASVACSGTLRSCEALHGPELAGCRSGVMNIEDSQDRLPDALCWMTLIVPKVTHAMGA